MHRNLPDFFVSPNNGVTLLMNLFLHVKNSGIQESKAARHFYETDSCSQRRHTSLPGI